LSFLTHRPEPLKRPFPSPLLHAGAAVLGKKGTQFRVAQNVLSGVRNSPAAEAERLLCSKTSGTLQTAAAGAVGAQTVWGTEAAAGPVGVTEPLSSGSLSGTFALLTTLT